MEAALTEIRVGDETLVAEIAATGAKLSQAAEPQARPRRSLPRAPDVEELLRRPPRQNIVWIASYPKSGNTWVRVFLHNLIRELRGETEGSQDINDLGRFAIWEQSLPNSPRCSASRRSKRPWRRARGRVRRCFRAQSPRSPRLISMFRSANPRKSLRR